MEVTQQYLKHVLSYDQYSGEFSQYKCEQEAGRIAAPYFADVAP